MPAAPRSLLRRVFRALFFALWMYALLELGAFVAVWSIQKSRPSHSAVLAQAVETTGLADADHAGAYEADHIRHPYLAFAPQPLDPPAFRGLHRLSSSVMADSDSPIYDPDALVVGLTGGSVAAGVFNAGGKALIKRLESAPQLAGRKVHLFGFPVAGLKQPQQATGFAYLIAAGVQFDGLINLDGFNEVSLTSDPSAKKGGFPAYPYQWGSRLALTTANRALAGELNYLDGKRKQAAQALGDCPARWSWLRKVAWVVEDAGLAAEREGALLTLRQSIGSKDDPLATFELLGPRDFVGTQVERQTELAAIWERGSMALRDLCVGQEATYVHALQPNQYDEEFRKPMGDKERRIAINPSSMFAAPARSGYPLLRQAAERLASNGIEVLDLKHLFQDVPEQLFRDDCCHFRPAGSVVIAQALADALLAAGFGDH